MILINNDTRLATLSLSTADVSIFLHANMMHIGGKLGSLELRDDSQVETSRPSFKQILSIEGDDFASFQYQTFDPDDKEAYRGVKSMVHLRAGSLKLHYLEEPLRDIYLFGTKLAKLKGLYDAAAEAAVQRAQEIERMQFEISIKTPIIIFPSDPQLSLDVLTVRLGELSARNNFEGSDHRTVATLQGIRVASTSYNGSELSTLKLVEDINIDARIVQTSNIDRLVDLSRPDTQVKYYSL